MTKKEKKAKKAKKHATRLAIDLSHPPALTAAQRAELKALASLPERSIDTSDLPPLGEDFWQRAVRNPLYRPRKMLKTVRIDADVLVWLQSQGKGYQSRLNAILRRAMVESVDGAAR